MSYGNYSPNFPINKRELKSSDSSVTKFNMHESEKAYHEKIKSFNVSGKMKIMLSTVELKENKPSEEIPIKRLGLWRSIKKHKNQKIKTKIIEAIE